MSLLSDEAQKFRTLVHDSAQFIATCDGGDPGTPDHPSTWLVGLEPGWSARDDDEEASGSGPTDAHYEEYSIDLQLTWPYNRNAFKLLAALAGENPRDYVAFATLKRPFTRGSKGYFKGNLFPAACNNVGDWRSKDQADTGFETKEEYRDWMRSARLPIFKSWIEKCRPKLMICVGASHKQDFMSVSDTNEADLSEYVFEVNGHIKRMFVSKSAIVPIAIVPHISGSPCGLNSYDSIVLAAEYIRKELM